MRKLLSNDNAEIKMIGMIVGILVTLIISILILYNVAGNIDTTSADENIRQNVYGEGGTTYKNGTTFAANASTNVLDQSATFFTIAPILAVVIVAVVIIGYVNRI